MGIPAPQLDDERYKRLVEELRAAIVRHAPEWTDLNDADPGITIVEVFAFLGEQLLYRANAIPGRRRRMLRETVARLASMLAGDDPATELLALEKRVRYFDGRLLTTADLRDEQEYHLRRRRLLNRALHGVGIVTGLDVRVPSEATPPAVVVAPGFALDAWGREVVLAASQTLEIEDGSPVRLVMVEYAERETDLVPAFGADGTTDTMMATRIEEGATIRLVDAADCPEGVVVGRLVRGAAGWTPDPKFVPRRVRDVPRG